MDGRCTSFWQTSKAPENRAFFLIQAGLLLARCGFGSCQSHPPGGFDRIEGLPLVNQHEHVDAARADLDLDEAEMLKLFEANDAPSWLLSQARVSEGASPPRIGDTCTVPPPPQCPHRRDRTFDFRVGLARHRDPFQPIPQSVTLDTDGLSEVAHCSLSGGSFHSSALARQAAAVSRLI